MVFLTIHPCNVLLALVCRLFGPVGYWRSEGLNRALLAPFEAIDPAKFFDARQWNDVLQDAHVKFAAQGASVPDLPLHACGVTVNFGRSWLQWFVMQFEADAACQLLAIRWARHRGLGQCRVFHSGVARWARGPRSTPANIEGVRRIRGSILADVLWEVLLSMRQVGVALIRCLAPRKQHPALRSRQFDYLFTGVASPDRAFRKQELDFAFMARRGLLPAGKCLFVLGRELNASQKSAFESTGAAAVSLADFAGALSFRQRLSTSVATICAVWRAFVHGSYARDVLPRMLARAVPLYALAHSTGVRVVVNGLDDGLLDPPAVPLLAAAGVRTVTWQHSLIGFAHGSSGTGFRNLVLEQAVSAAETHCVWVPACMAMLRDREMPVGAMGRDIRIIGPAMSGDSSWLNRSSGEARAALGISSKPGAKVVAVFDIPTFKLGLKRNYRVPIERIPEPAHEGFYLGILKLLHELPDVTVLVKPKRGADPRFHSGSAFSELVDPDQGWVRSGRVHLVSSHVDPYLPVAAADLCIGMPFTSPVVVSLNAGRPAFWYDQTGFIGETYPRDLEPFLVRGEDQLMLRTRQFFAGAAAPTPPCLRSPLADPLVALAGVITGAVPNEESVASRTFKLGAMR